MNKTSKVILGITAAAVAGTAIGWLLASDRGHHFQRRIKDEFSSRLNSFNTMVAELKSSGRYQPTLTELNDFDIYETTDFKR